MFGEIAPRLKGQNHPQPGDWRIASQPMNSAYLALLSQTGGTKLPFITPVTASATYGGGNLAIGENARITSSAGASMSTVIGTNASANAGSSTVIGGSTSASGSGQHTVVGTSTSCTGSTSSTAVGTSVSNGGSNATAIGNSVTVASAGNYGIVIGTYSTAGQAAAVSIGTNHATDFAGQIGFNTGGVTIATSDLSFSFVPMWMSTTNATVTELKTGTGAYTTTPTGVIVLTNDSTYLFDFDVIARNTGDDTQSAAWNVKFAIRRGAAAANTVLIGTPTKTIVGQDTGTTTWDVNVTADTTNGRPNISVTGEAGKTIYWAAFGKMTKIKG